MGESEEYTKALVGKGGLKEIGAARKKYQKAQEKKLDEKLKQFKTASERDAYLKGRIDADTKHYKELEHKRLRMERDKEWKKETGQ